MLLVDPGCGSNLGYLALSKLIAVKEDLEKLSRQFDQSQSESQQHAVEYRKGFNRLKKDFQSLIEKYPEA